MKVAHIADIHLRGGADSPEAVALMEAADIMKREGVTLCAIPGDIYEAEATRTQREQFTRFLETLLANEIEVVIVRGNHDLPGELDTLRIAPGVHVFEKPGSVMIGDLQVLTVPHFSASAIAQLASTREEMAEIGTELFGRILDDYFQRIQSHKGPSIVLAHAVVDGARLDSGFIPRQNGIHLSLAKLMSFGCPVMLGHYHAQQSLSELIAYSGSITRQTFGEAGEKGILIWEIDGRNYGAPAFHPIPQTDQFTFDNAWEGTGLKYALPSGSFVGAKVRFRYTVRQSELAQVDLSDVLKVFEGAQLKIERQIIFETAIRNAEIAEKQSIEERLVVWMEAKAFPAEDIEACVSAFREITEPAPMEEAA